MQIEIGYTKSNRAQVCCKCGKTIPAREQSVKTTRKWWGAVSMTDTRYHCMECEKGMEGNKNDEV